MLVLLFATGIGTLPAKAEADDPIAETAGGWFKSLDNHVLGGKLGTCFGIPVLKEGEDLGS